MLKFPVTAAGETSEAQLKICNGSKDDQYGVSTSYVFINYSLSEDLECALPLVICYSQESQL